MPEINPIAQAQIDKIAEDCKRIKPLVAIQCITYNHEPYIRDALEGFVMQKTDFPFVAIVHDDASTDGTAAIIREYAEKYPDIIKPIYESENQYSKGSLGQIMRKALCLTEVKYLALCEGDDFWTHPLKLQKQVDFLEANIDYSMCFHNVEIIQQGIEKLDMPCNNIESRNYTTEILDKWIVATCSTMIKSELINYVPIDKRFIVGDNVLWATCLSLGKVRGLSYKMGKYRQQPNGWIAQSTQNRMTRYENQLKWINHFTAMREHFTDPNIKKIFSTKIKESLARIVIADTFFNRKNIMRHIKSGIHECGMKFYFAIFKALILYLFNLKKLIQKR